MSNVVKFPEKLSSVDEAMAWLNDLHSKGRLTEMLLVAVDSDGHYEIALTKMTAMHALYNATYLKEKVMQTLREEGLMPSSS